MGGGRVRIEEMGQPARQTSTARDGAMAPRWRGTARWLLDGEGWRDGSLTTRDGTRRLLNGKGRRECGGDGPRAQRQWVAMDSKMANGR